MSERNRTRRRLCTQAPPGQASSGRFLQQTRADSNSWLDSAPSSPVALTFGLGPFLLEGCAETLEYHAVAGALHPDLLVQDPEKAPGILRASPRWEADLAGEPRDTEKP